MSRPKLLFLREFFKWIKISFSKK